MEIADALCTIDDLERANDSQLNIIFRELQQTNFFQHFVVDLEHKCQIWNKDNNTKQTKTTVVQNDVRNTLKGKFKNKQTFTIILNTKKK